MKPTRLATLVTGLVLTATAGGCATFGTLQTANTLGKGKSQTAVEAGTWGAISGTGAQLEPDLELSIRYGLTDTLDIGGRVGGNGLELGAKLQLTRPKAPGMIVSVAPIVGGGALAAQGSSIVSYYLQVPVLLGFRLGGGNQLVLSPKLEYWHVNAQEPSQGIAIDGTFITVGASLGVSLKLGKSIHVMPELSAVAPVVVIGPGGTATGLGGLLVQFSVAAMFGG